MKEYSPFVPFDLYDFFGYLFPGILFAGNALIFMNLVDHSFYSNNLKSIFIVTNGSEYTFIGILLLIVFGVVLLYTMGHVIATVSHIIIDRVLIDGVEGYPINFLLEIPRETRHYSEATFKYLFILFNLLFVPPLIIGDHGLFRLLVQIILGLIGALIVLRVIIMRIRDRKGKEYAQKKGDHKILRLYYWPSDKIIDNYILGFLKRLLGMDRKFPKAFIESFKVEFKKRYPCLVSDEVGTENYWLSLLHVNSNNLAHQRTLLTWLHLYGFARNACASFYFIGFLIICHIIFNASALTTAVRMQLGALWILAILLGLRYWILYSHYYSKAAIRAFYEVVTKKNH